MRLSAFRAYSEACSVDTDTPGSCATRLQAFRISLSIVATRYPSPGWLPGDFIIGGPIYDEDRKAATIRVEMQWGQGPRQVKTDFTSFRAVKADDTWKLLLDPPLFTSAQ